MSGPRNDDYQPSEAWAARLQTDALADYGLTGEDVDERFAAIPGFQPSKR